MHLKMKEKLPSLPKTRSIQTGWQVQVIFKTDVDFPLLSVLYSACSC